MDLRFLWSPKSVAIVGASERAGHGASVSRNLLKSGFKGAIYPVNPKYSSIDGLPCYPSLGSLPATPDSVVVAVPGESAIAVLREAGERGTRAGVIFSSGFAEAGEQGRRLQEELRSVALQYDMAVCGPNCMGIVNLVDRIPLYAAPVPPLTKTRAGNVAVVAQSGSVSVLFLYHADRVRCSYIASSGNQAVVDTVDYLRYFIDDRRTDVIALFMETVDRADELYAALQLAGEVGKAVVICKTGRSERGRQATIAHTGALAQPFEAFEGICRQTGTILVSDLDEMLETVAMLSAFPRSSRPGAEIGLLTASGGQNALILDIANEIGLSFASLSEATRASMRRHLPDYATVDNPLDVTGTLLFDPDAYSQVLMAMALEPDIGVMVASQEMPRMTLGLEDRRRFWHTMEALARMARESGKPSVFMTPIMMPSDRSVTKLFRDSGVTILKGLRSGLLALRNSQAWLRFQGRPRRPASTLTTTADLTDLQFARPANSTVLHERLALTALAHAGLPVVPHEIAADSKGLVEAAEVVGYPLVLKVDSPDILHKTDVGGVKVGIQDVAGLVRAHAEMTEDIRHRAPNAAITGFLLQKAITPIVELIVGYRSDPDFGPLILLGLGGPFVELLEKIAIRRLPIDGSALEDMFDEVKPLRKLILGVRGSGAGDVAALSTMLQRFSDFCIANSDHLSEVDLNPVAILPVGVCILDALIVLQDRPAANGAPTARPSATGSAGEWD